jgi:multicomponent Na+:H+ antiporter subunit B
MIQARQQDSVVIRFVTRASIPFLQLYALYVLGHGEDSPGGGFQGGVIFGAAYALYALVNGWEAGRARWPEPVTSALLPTGAMVYGGIGLAALLVGGMFLEYEALAPGHPHEAHHFGLMGIEIGVMITVSASIATLFFEMARPRLFLDAESRGRAAAEGEAARGPAEPR